MPGEVPEIKEMVAVGAIAITVPLRIPCLTSWRKLSQSRRLV